MSGRRAARRRRAAAAGWAAGLSGDELAATIEATISAAALRAQKTGTPGRRVTVDVSWAHRPTPDLSSEAGWLARVSRAFTGSPLVHELARNGRSGDPPNGAAPSVSRERPHRR
jgi:hypothetical protein